MSILWSRQKRDKIGKGFAKGLCQIFFSVHGALYFVDKYGRFRLKQKRMSIALSCDTAELAL